MMGVGLHVVSTESPVCPARPSWSAPVRRGLVGCALALAALGCGGRAQPAATPESLVGTGDPAPAGPVDDADCPDSGTRWLGVDPHVPMAIVDERGIRGAGQRCCAEWAVVGATWKAIDRWGRVVGDARVEGGEGYDLTQCYELSLRVPDGATGLFASGDFRPAPSAEWTPSAAEKDSFVAFAAHADALFEATGYGDETPAALLERTMFFRAPPNERDETAPTRFAVTGGRVLLVGALRRDGRWAVSHLDSAMSVAGYAPADAYRVIAVFDMDGDGVPEIVFHESDGPSWVDVVLGMRPDDSARPWSRIAESVGGSTA